jgi:hypothetical protein
MIRNLLTKNALATGALMISTLLVAGPASAQTTDHAPVDLSSSGELAQDGSGKEAWTYLRAGTDFRRYKNVIVEPTAVYAGPDAQFGDITQADRAAYAQILTSAVQSEIGKVYPRSGAGLGNTLRVQMSLLGAKKTIGGVATATRITPIGFGLSAAKSLLGKRGTFTGSVLFAVEVYDAKTNELLLSAVRRRTPDPLDIPATLSTTNTVKAVARDFAVSARQRLQGMTGVPAIR